MSSFWIVHELAVVSKTLANRGPKLFYIAEEFANVGRKSAKVKLAIFESVARVKPGCRGEGIASGHGERRSLRKLNPSSSLGISRSKIMIFDYHG